MKAERKIAIIPSEAFTSNPAVLLSTKKLYEIASTPEISGGSIKVLLFILSRISNAGEVCISPSTIANELRITRSSVNKALATLENFKVIIPGERKHHTMFFISEGIINGVADL